MHVIEATAGPRRHQLILGDNLPVMQALAAEGARFKLILTDPPYGTGRVRQGYADSQAEWADMMYPRLCVLAELLEDGGILLMHMDDGNDAHLRIMLDGLLGRENRLPVMVWERTPIRINSSATLSRAHEYIIGYALPGARVNPESADSVETRFANPDSDPRGPWHGRAMVANGTGYVYPITGPRGQIAMPPKGKGWSVKQETYRRYLTDNLIWWGKDGGSKSPSVKRFEADLEEKGVVPRTWLPGATFGYGAQAAEHIKRDLKGPHWSSAKPIKLVSWLVERFTQPGDQVLDIFAGSGTVAEAVAQVNGLSPGIPPRTTVMIQRRERSEVRHHGGTYGFNIASLTALRLRYVKATFGEGYEIISA
jgi:adenine-specific DNA-methyltransferase